MARQAQVSNVFYFIVALFLMSISYVFGFWLVSTFYNTANTILPAEVNAQLLASQNSFAFADYAYPIAVVLLSVALIYTYFFIPSNPVLIVVEFVILGFVIIMGRIVSNVNDKLFNGTGFSTAMDSFPLTNLVNNNFGLIGGVIGLIVLVVYFAKRGDGGGGAFVG